VHSSSRKLAKWPPRLRLFRHRTILCPTWAGCFCFATILLLLVVALINYGGSYLALTHRVTADILMVDGWIGRRGLRAAVDEFGRGGYRFIVASGGLTSEAWIGDTIKSALDQTWQRSGVCGVLAKLAGGLLFGKPRART
jgi:hypothetical protein